MTPKLRTRRSHAIALAAMASAAGMALVAVGGSAGAAPGAAQTAEARVPLKESTIRVNPSRPARVTIYAATEAPRERAGRLADEMKSLIDAAAAGDRRAAFDLATGLRACARAYRRPDELEAAISMLRTQRKLKTADMSAPLDVISNAETELLVQRELVEPFEYCRGVERNTISRADEWLRRSAKAGYPAAVQALLPELDNSDESIALLESAWRDGRTWALEPLALRYSEGVAGRAPDLIRAYAYRLLHVRLLEAMTAAPPGPVATKVLTQARADLDALGRQLKPAQLSASTELAEELLTRNSRCCTPS